MTIKVRQATDVPCRLIDLKNEETQEPCFADFTFGTDMDPLEEIRAMLMEYAVEMGRSEQQLYGAAPASSSGYRVSDSNRFEVPRRLAWVPFVR